jgi:hypothetical protein
MEEVDILRHCIATLGPELRGLPDDLITMLVRGTRPPPPGEARPDDRAHAAPLPLPGIPLTVNARPRPLTRASARPRRARAGYVSEKDPKAQTVAHMIETSEWRKENDVDGALLPGRVPALRKEFETMWRSSIIGEDQDGHPIILESIGKIPTKEFGAQFTGSPEKEASFLNHTMFNKEVRQRRSLVAVLAATGRAYTYTLLGWNNSASEPAQRPRKPERGTCVCGGGQTARGLTWAGGGAERRTAGAMMRDRHHARCVSCMRECDTSSRARARGRMGDMWWEGDPHWMGGQFFV